MPEAWGEVERTEFLILWIPPTNKTQELTEVSPLGLDKAVSSPDAFACQSILSTV